MTPHSSSVALNRLYGRDKTLVMDFIYCWKQLSSQHCMTPFYPAPKKNKDKLSWKKVLTEQEMKKTLYLDLQCPPKPGLLGRVFLSYALLGNGRAYWEVLVHWGMPSQSTMAPGHEEHCFALLMLMPWCQSSHRPNSNWVTQSWADISTILPFTCGLPQEFVQEGKTEQCTGVAYVTKIQEGLRQISWETPN